MPMKDECYNCTRYDVSCDGNNGYARGKRSGVWKKKCSNQDSGGVITKSTIQVNAFKSLYKAKIGADKKWFIAFAETIAQTSDDAFKNADKNLLEKYYNLII